MSARTSMLLALVALAGCAPAQVFSGTMTRTMMNPTGPYREYKESGVTVVVSPSRDPKSVVVSLLEDVPLLLHRDGMLQKEELVAEEGAWIQRMTIVGSGSLTANHLTLSLTLESKVTDDGVKTETRQTISYGGDQL